MKQEKIIAELKACRANNCWECPRYLDRTIGDHGVACYEQVLDDAVAEIQRLQTVVDALQEEQLMYLGGEEHCKPHSVTVGEYTIHQAENCHYTVTKDNGDGTGTFISHASCTKPLSEDEMIKSLNSTLKLLDYLNGIEEDDDDN